MPRRLAFTAAAAVCFMIGSPVISRAGFAFLGPTPYLSKADSPFPVDGGNPAFHLEDFEDGSFNSLGIVLPSNPNARGIVLPAGGMLTNSVDMDDAQLDGAGKDGRSLMSTAYTTKLVDPPTISSYISFSFDGGELGFLPTAFGFVWTYGRQNSVVRLDVFDGNGAYLGFSAFTGIGNGIDNDTSDDAFFGVRSSDGISGVLITTSYPGEPYVFEIDHVQYGLVAPEPSTISMVVVGVIGAYSRRGFFGEEYKG